MEKEELQELFCVKIGLEYGRFRQKVLKENPAEIYGKSYQIDCMVNIYELLLEMSQKMQKEVIESLILVPNLLAFIYDKWMKQEDSFTQELWECIEESVRKPQIVRGNTPQERKGEEAA